MVAVTNPLIGKFFGKGVKQKQIIRKARDHAFSCKYLKLNACSRAFLIIRFCLTPFHNNKFLLFTWQSCKYFSFLHSDHAKYLFLGRP